MGVLLDGRYIGGFTIFSWETRALLAQIKKRRAKRYVFSLSNFILITLASGVIMDTIEF